MRAGTLSVIFTSWHYKQDTVSAHYVLLDKRMDRDLDKETENAMGFHKLISLLNIRCVIDLKDYLAYIVIF